MTMHANDFLHRPFPCQPALDQYLARQRSAEREVAHGRSKTLPVLPGHLRLVMVEDAVAPATPHIRLATASTATALQVVEPDEVPSDEAEVVEVVTTRKLRTVAAEAGSDTSAAPRTLGSLDPLVKNWYVLGCMA